MKKTYHGGCHCGAVRFRCETDLTAATSRCNCSHCRMNRFWKVFVPNADFELLSGADNLSEYRFNSNTIQHVFCRTCGVRPFGRGDIAPLGPFHAVNVACLDASDEDLAGAALSFENGRDDDWDHAPAVTSYL